MLLYSAWLALPINTRHEIAKGLGIVKKTPTHVQDNVIVSDGYNIHDVENALTVENLQNYLGVGLQETDINVLWDMLINPMPDVHMTPTNLEPATDKPKGKGGRPKGAKNKTVL